MLDDILTSTVFTLIAAGLVAIAVVSLQPSPIVESSAARDLAETIVDEPSQPMATMADKSPTTVQLPTVVVTGHRVQSSDKEHFAEGY